MVSPKNFIPLFDDGVPFAYTKEIPAFAMPAGPVARMAGYRSKKYEIQRGANFYQDNDWVIYRLSDVYLMYREKGRKRVRRPAFAE